LPGMNPKISGTKNLGDVAQKHQIPHALFATPALGRRPVPHEFGSYPGRESLGRILL
jgi:hypothetical protein